MPAVMTVWMSECTLTDGSTVHDVYLPTGKDGKDGVVKICCRDSEQAEDLYELLNETLDARII